MLQPSLVALVLAGPIDELAPGHWLEVPDSQMRSVDPCPTSDCPWSAVEGQAGVMDDWSGGAFDSARDRLLVWGGGHGGYAGNEIYAFALAELAWTRLNEPSDPAGVDVPHAPDGRPTSRHTYDYVQYVAGIDALCSFGGAGFYVSGQTGTDGTDCFHFASGEWESHATSIFHGIGSTTAYDPIADRVWGRGTGSSPDYATATILGVWDPQADVFTPGDGGNEDLAYSYAMTSTIDPNRGLFVSIGAGATIVWDISDGQTASRLDIATTGATEIEGSDSPGVAWDPHSDRVVAWGGGGQIYTLDLDSLAWTRVEPAPDNTTVPTEPNGNGTFGRFRYSTASNVFVLVNAVDENVFVYRLTDGSGTPIPAVTLSASPDAIAVGDGTTLSWQASDATTCTAGGGWSGERATSGMELVGPLDATTEFTLSCSGPAGVGGASVVVMVGDDGSADGTSAGGPATGAATDAPPAGTSDAGATSGAGEDAGSDGGAAASDDDAATGCGCTHGGPTGLAAAWFLLPIVAARRRRTDLAG